MHPLYRQSHSRCLPIVLALTMVATIASAVHAQEAIDPTVDLRVNPGMRYDVNTSLSRGMLRPPSANYPTLTRPMSPLVGGNLYASGNVGRGMALRSVSPIPSPTDFRAPLGSASLYTFRRDSISAADAYRPVNTLSSRAFARPYYDPSTTAYTTGFLTGQTLPGVRSPAMSEPLDLRMRLTQSPAGVYQLVDPGAEDAWATTSSIFGTQPPPAPPLSVPLGAEPPLPWERRTPERIRLPGLEEPFRESTPAVSDLFPPTTDPTRTRRFDVERPEDQARRPSLRLDAEGTAAAADNRRGGETTPLDALLSGNMLNSVGVLDSDADAPTWAAGWRGGRLQPGLILPERLEETADPEADSLTLSQRLSDPSVLPGYDVFTDMRLALALEDSPASAWFDEMQQALVEEPDLAPGAMPEAPTADLEEADEFVARVLETPLTTFTGRGASIVNDLLLKAESLMDIGHFAEAADRYEAAHIADPANPLPLIGKAHALLAAGDYRSAALALAQGLRQYPEVSRFRFDLTSLMGGGENIDIRRSDIMRQLDQRETAELRFLLGYLEYHGGYRERGLENLERAAALDLRGSILSQYPAMLRGETVLPAPRAPLRTPTPEGDKTSPPPAGTILEPPADEPLVVPPREE